MLPENISQPTASGESAAEIAALWEVVNALRLRCQNLMQEGRDAADEGRQIRIDFHRSRQHAEDLKNWVTLSPTAPSLEPPTSSPLSIFTGTGILAPLKARPIVVLIASAGGLQPILEILRALPRDFPAPVIVLQHDSRTDTDS